MHTDNGKISQSVFTTRSLLSLKDTKNTKGKH